METKKLATIVVCHFVYMISFKVCMATCVQPLLALDKAFARFNKILIMNMDDIVVHIIYACVVGLG